jgi:hypothetical protein
MHSLDKLLKNASARLTGLRHRLFFRWYRSEFRRLWINRRWRKHLPKRQWSGSAPMTLPVLKAEIRHRLMRKQLAKAPKYLREGTPEFERARNQLYGNHPEPKCLSRGSQA